MIKFDELQSLLADWYEVTPNELGLPESKIPDWINPVLKDFYGRFGMLAERSSRFAHPDSDNTPLSCQDHIVPARELVSRNGYTVFCDENQSVFVAAASDDPSDVRTYVEGDGVFHDRRAKMTDIGVPLVECLITSTLRETILSISDRYRKITPESLKASLSTAKSGNTIKSRYIWPDIYFTFFLSKDIWFMDWEKMQFAAHRGLWRHKPSTWQDQLFDDGASWSSGPSNPTTMQKLQRLLTGFRK